MDLNFDNLKLQIAEGYNKLYAHAVEIKDEKLLSILCCQRLYIGMLLLCESEGEIIKSITDYKLKGACNENT